MMTCFYEIGSVWQASLLILNLFAVIALTGCCILRFRRRRGTPTLLAMGAVLLLNAVLFVPMQLDSRLTGGGQTPHLHLPCGGILLITLASLGYALWVLLYETRNRKTITHTSIKEAFDNLPAGVCFFNESGLAVLCNRAMHRFSFAVCGKDLQFVTDPENWLTDCFRPADGVVRDGDVFLLPDGRAWHLEKRLIPRGNGSMYTQFIATDITELHTTRTKLTQETQQLRRVQADLKRLSANIVAVTREEEILNTKMRVHDEMGRCLVEACEYLKQDNSAAIPDRIARSWQRAVSMLKYNIESRDEDMLLQIRKTCESVNLRFIQTGELPKQERTAYILTCAVRECVTNAVRYAEASELYTEFTETDRTATVTVTNNGKRPEGEIVEGGGLSTLRRRVERAGGTMVVQSLPKFKLTVTVPTGKEGVS